MQEKCKCGWVDMDVYDSLLNAVQTEYDTVRCLKKSERGSVSVVRHRQSGERFIFRRYQGSGAVYRKLLSVSCPNLPQIMETAERNGHVVVLEELVRGDTLAFVLEGGTLSTQEARCFAGQICQALYVLHTLGAVHRDVKPENILLRGGEAVLIDFDASRIYHSDAPELTADTMILGTTGYAAPEQYGMSQTDPRADIYSLGVLLNVMLTGEHPSRRLASGRLGRVIRRCTMMSPGQRYQNVLELLGEL